MDKTYIQLMAELKTKATAYKALLDGNPTTEQMAEIDTLGAEIDTLETKAAEVKKLDDAKAANTKRLAFLNDPVRPGFHTSEPEKKGLEFDGKVEFAFAPTVKHFKGATNAEAAEKAFRFGKFIQGYVAFSKSNPEGHIAARQWCQDHEIKVSQELTPQDGGVLVPIEFERTLIDLRELYGVARANMKNEPMASETKIISRRTGGLTVYFVG